jgi:hypothetical protein
VARNICPSNMNSQLMNPKEQSFQKHQQSQKNLTTTSQSEPWRFDWIAVSFRPDPITSDFHEVVIGRGFSTNKGRINIQFDTFPIADSDNFCKVILRPAEFIRLDEKWPERWTVLSHKTDSNGVTKITIIGTGWIEDNEMLVLLDALSTPNQNIECWITLKPRIERHKTYEIDQ